MTIETVRRIDRVRLDAGKARKLDNGFLRAPAQISRIGIYEYLNADGSIRRELRLPDDVFHEDSLRSFSLMPVTDGHPATGWITAENAREFQRGQMGEIIQPAPDGVHVAGPMMITDSELVRKVLDGESPETSCGYTCQVEERSGRVDEEMLKAYPGLKPWAGQHFDCIQKNIRGNHVAVLPRGRAGPEARVKLDSGDAIVITDSREVRDVNTQEATVKITIRGITFDVPDQAAEALLAERQDTQDALATAGEQIEELEGRLAEAGTATEKEKARADAAEAENKTLKQRVDGGADRKGLVVLVRDHLDVLDLARRAGLEPVKLDETFDIVTVKRSIAEKINGVKLDGKSADYVAASFDIAKGKLDDQVTGTELAPALERDDEHLDGKGTGDARQDMMDRQAKAWKQVPPGAVRADGK